MTMADNILSLNSFRAFWQIGYTNLVPIVPHDAEVSARSTLFKRKGALGKAVGYRGHDGLWRGFDWIPYRSTETDIDRWQAMGAGVGIKTGRTPGTDYSLIAIDADTLTEKHAKIVRDTADAYFGRTPLRVGRYPKALYVMRVPGDFRYTRIEFGERTANGDLAERVEVLSDGRQFVAQGIHPNTLKPYTWPRTLVPVDNLPQFPAERVHEFLDALRPLLPAASKVIEEGASTTIDQALLRGDPELVRKAVSLIPNTSKAFPTRESYRDFGYAIKASLEDEFEAFEIFAEWCARWENADGRVNDPDIVEADWRRMKPPFRRGASWLYELAERQAPGSLGLAERWFAPLEDEAPSPFQAVMDEEAQKRSTDYYETLTVDDVFNRPDPKWMIERYVPETGVGFLYGDPGTGKSFLALDIGLHIAYGRQDWHGDKILAPDGDVIYIAAEGAAGMKPRIRAWLDKNGIPEGVTPRFRLLPTKVRFMKPEDIDRLIRTIEEHLKTTAALIVVDTVSRAMPGAKENLQEDMTLFVEACDQLKERFNSVVLGVHHAAKSGDMRGSTVLEGAGDFVLKLSRAKGAVIGSLFCEKQKDGPDGWTEQYRFDAVSIGESQSSLVPSRYTPSAAPIADMPSTVASGILEAMRMAWEADAPWSRSSQAGERRAVRILARDHGMTVDAAESLLELWEATGTVRYHERRTGRGGKRPPGYEVTGSIAEENGDEGGAFG